jgi:predicted membrane protein
MPSGFGMKILQYTQLISISILVIISIVGVINDVGYTLIRYWLGILCFIITLFGIQSQEKFISYYKPIGLTLITGAYYITLFDSMISIMVMYQYDYLSVSPRTLSSKKITFFSQRYIILVEYDYHQ